MTSAWGIASFSRAVLSKHPENQRESLIHRSAVPAFHPCLSPAVRLRLKPWDFNVREQHCDFFYLLGFKTVHCGGNKNRAATVLSSMVVVWGSLMCPKGARVQREVFQRAFQSQPRARAVLIRDHFPEMGICHVVNCHLLQPRTRTHSKKAALLTSLEGMSGFMFLLAFFKRGSQINSMKIQELPCHWGILFPTNI